MAMQTVFPVYQSEQMRSSTNHSMDGIYDSVVNDFPIDSSVVAENSKKNPILSRVVWYIQNGWPRQLPSSEANLIPYFRLRLSLCMCTNVVLLQTDHTRVVVPHCLQSLVLSLLHVGHWREIRMKQMSRRCLRRFTKQSVSAPLVRSTQVIPRSSILVGHAS